MRKLRTDFGRRETLENIAAVAESVREVTSTIEHFGDIIETNFS